MNSKNKKIFIGIVISLFVVLNIYNIPLTGVDEDYKKINNNEIISKSNLNLDDLYKSIKNSSTKEYNFKNYDSLLISFWATWCPSCKSENKIFNSFMKKNQQTLIIGICMDRDKNALTEYLKSNEINFDTLNITKEISKLFDDIVAVPTHFIINNSNGSYIKELGLLTENELNSYIEQVQQIK